MDSDIFGKLLLLDNLLVEDGGGALGERVALQLGALLVGLDKVALEGRLVLGNDGDVDVGAGAEIVEDTREDGVAGELDGVVLGQLGLPLRLKDTHGRQTTGAHGHVGELVSAAVRVHREQVRARRVAAGHDQVRANVALVAEEVLLQHRHARHHARLAARRQAVQLQLRRDERRRELGVGGGSGARAPDLRRNVVQLFAVLVCYDGSGCGSRIGGNLDGDFLSVMLFLQ